VTRNCADMGAAMAGARTSGYRREAELTSRACKTETQTRGRDNRLRRRQAGPRWQREERVRGRENFR
jgi:hypothetical protein